MNSHYQKSLRLQVSELQSKYNEIQSKQEAVIGKLPKSPTREQKEENMKEWLEKNDSLRKLEKQIQNAKRLLARSQGLHKTENSN